MHVSEAEFHTQGLRQASTDADVRFACPRCGSSLASRQCRVCGFQLSEHDGIFDALLPERKTHYARFIEDYETVRAAEGRAGPGDDFYLSLPYRDASGRNSRQWQIRSQSFDCLMRVLKTNFPKAGARVLDLGAGNGWLSYRLASAGYCPVAVDLLMNKADGLGAAAHYRGSLRNLFPRVRAELMRLPFEREQFDAAIFNASFHYAEDYLASLREAFRCARTGGMVVICDTPWYSSDGSGQKMLVERRKDFVARYGFASDSIQSMEYLTDERLRALERQLSIRWTRYMPRYDLRWRMRPLVARLRRRREPSRFRIYTARKEAG